MSEHYIPADVPEDAKSDYAKYSKTVERQFRHESRWTRAMWVIAAVTILNGATNLYSSVIATATNLELVKVAMQQPVRYVERGSDGIDRVIAVRNTMDVNKGREMETVMWFVTWSRWISGEKAVNEVNRAAARAKLAGQEATNRWEQLVSKDPDPRLGTVRDVLGVVVAEQDIIGLEPGKRNYQISWQEKTLRNGKVTSDTTMTMNVTIIQGPPRDGALDGVNIVLLTEPTPHIKQRNASDS
jgi:type IV secretory pathway TrbF-like protein